jgi:glycosyltransferase involved in cell wall biosynthesis
MRVTFVLPYSGLQGGLRVIATYAERLQQRGHEVFAVSTPETIRFRRKIKSLLLGQGIPQVQPSYFDRMAVPHRVLETVRPVTDADVPDADVVIATYYTTAPGVLRLSPSKGAKAIFIQGYEVEDGRSNPELDESWRMPLHKITISAWLVALARDRFGDPTVSHVPNSVDFTQFHAPPRTKSEVPTVGLLYNTSPLKGLDTSVAALERLAQTIPSLRVVSFGTERPGFTSPLPRATEFHYRPRQDMIRELYAQCDAWMCGSNREGFHLPPLEAMACRCPVVSTKVGGPLDIIEDGVNGFLVEIKDAAALADRTARVLNLSPADWKRMSDSAYRTATSFTLDEATDLFEKALHLAVERSRRGDLVDRRKSLTASGA